MNAGEPLARFERLARRLIEGSFRSLFGGPLASLDLGPHLARAVEDGSRDGRAPNRIEIRLHPADHEAVLTAHPAVHGELIGFVQTLSQQLGLVLPRPPQIQLLVDEKVRRRTVVVETAHWSAADETTQMRAGRRPDSYEALQAREAFLIVEGQRHVPLRKQAISLGRRPDNDIVINNPNVSRHHAQVRWRYGRFVIYDLGSRGGTRVNGQLIRECVLHPGDVILLSTVPVIYGESTGDRGQGGDTLVRRNGRGKGT
jgi:hypothetical protein